MELGIDGFDRHALRPSALRKAQAGFAAPIRMLD
jgi:hypothetical protein